MGMISVVLEYAEDPKIVLNDMFFSCKPFLPCVMTIAACVFSAMLGPSQWCKSLRSLSTKRSDA